MNKRVLIISPYFPPVNSADMQRVRMSVPYFDENGWDTEIVMLDEKYSDMPKDDLLLLSVPPQIKIHKVKAVHKKLTSAFGLGSAAIRSFMAYRNTVNKILCAEKFDLIYFSTTQFPVCALGAYWKRKFNVPYIIDMQDPWFTGRDLSGIRSFSKHGLSYKLHKYLEATAMRKVGGLISVSGKYVSDLRERYRELEHVPAETITFGAADIDMKIATDHKDKFRSLLDPSARNIVYAGRGGTDLHRAIAPVFEALKQGIINDPDIFGQIKLYFIGTSYAPRGHEAATITPLAERYGVEKHVVEIPERIGYYHTLVTLQQADALFMPGSDVAAYSPSKIYPYMMVNKPLLAIFNPNSPVLDILHEFNALFTYSYDMADLDSKISAFLSRLANGSIETRHYSETAIEKYSARNMAYRQCAFFEKVLNE